VRSYGRLPVGNGHAAAGFNAVFAPGAAAVDGAVGDGITAGFAAGFGLLAARFLAALRGAARFLAAFLDFLADFFAPFLLATFFFATFLVARFFIDFLAVFLPADRRFLEDFFDDFFADFLADFFAFFAFFIAMMNLLQCTCVLRLGRKPAVLLESSTRRAIHRRMQMLWRRNTPRNAFVIPQIREMRGTGSALTADADEFGTAREKRDCGSYCRGCARQKRRSRAGA
jgi:hypothetical protein